MLTKYEETSLPTDFMTVCYKSSWQFCIMVEKYAEEGFSYSEYPFDMGPIRYGVPLYGDDFELLEKKHPDVDSFSHKIRSLKSEGYKVVFSATVNAEKIDTFIVESNESLNRHDGLFAGDVYPILVRYAKNCGIGDLDVESGLNYCSMKSFQSYLNSISNVLLQAQRQNVLPSDCINIIWFYAMQGLLKPDVFLEQQTKMKKISAQCVIDSYNGRFFSWRSNESKEFINKLSDVVENSPGEIDKTVTDFTDKKSEGTAIELLEKYHLTMK